ncbi:hypothetical protein [Campylobacter troglodytis]|uniref:hypothetical protein n=1 Tax=Campylobacter troglodytis TaxID=654363 RepID=UPI0011592C3D|nr:hypothetical protein [Campylobacter troglodytis]
MSHLGKAEVSQLVFCHTDRMRSISELKGFLLGLCLVSCLVARLKMTKFLSYLGKAEVLQNKAQFVIPSEVSTNF